MRQRLRLVVMPTEGDWVRVSHFAVLALVMITAGSSYTFAHVVEPELNRMDCQFYGTGSGRVCNCMVLRPTPERGRAGL